MSETPITEEAVRPLREWNPLDYLRLLLNAIPAGVRGKRSC